MKPGYANFAKNVLVKMTLETRNITNESDEDRVEEIEFKCIAWRVRGLESTKIEIRENK